MKERIKQIRTTIGMNQTDFAKKLLVSRSAICKIESGENSPSEQTINLICREFNINETWLRTGEGEPFKKRTENQEILSFANNIMEETNDAFKKRFVRALSKLNASDWETVEKFINELHAEELSNIN